MTQDIAARLRALTGTPFMKMTGSGNDFVVFDGREVDGAALTQPEVIAAICDRHNGIGADGLVMLEPSVGEDLEPAPVRLRYFNRDGTLGELCGNATLCSTRFALLRGMTGPAASNTSDLLLDTDSGRVRARLVDGSPEIDLAPVTEVNAALDGVATAPGIRRIGYARVGVPHVVLLTEALEAIDVTGEGRPIRQHERLSPDGANVNWLAPLADGRWAYRTYERGVEDETLACGTGAIACAILLTEWGLAKAPVELVTRSGRPVTVSFREGSDALALAAAESPSVAAGERLQAIAADAADFAVPALGDPARRPTRQWHASLRGEGRVVFRGTIATLA